jgi:hypothetical protein
VRTKTRKKSRKDEEDQYLGRVHVKVTYELLESLRAMALRKGIAFSSLIRLWLSERLEKEERK